MWSIDSNSTRFTGGCTCYIPSGMEGIWFYHYYGCPLWQSTSGIPLPIADEPIRIVKQVRPGLPSDRIKEIINNRLDARWDVPRCEDTTPDYERMRIDALIQILDEDYESQI